MITENRLLIIISGLLLIIVGIMVHQQYENWQLAAKEEKSKQWKLELEKNRRISRYVQEFKMKGDNE